MRTLTGHRRGIACLQYRDRLVVSGSSDNTIRIWDIETGVCFRVLEGHEELVRCIRFDSKRIVSGAYDGLVLLLLLLLLILILLYCTQSMEIFPMYFKFPEGQSISHKRHKSWHIYLSVRAAIV